MPYSDWHEDSDTLEGLRRFHLTMAREPDYQYYKDMNHTLISDIRDALKADHLCKYVEFTGSAYEGVQIGPDVEFDVMFIMDGSNIEKSPSVDGYLHLSRSDHFSWGSNSNKVLDKISCSDALSPDGVIEVFFGYLQKVVNKLNFVRHGKTYEILLRRHGPAIQMDVEEVVDYDRKLCYSVDMVPAFKLHDGTLCVAKPFKGDELPLDIENHDFVKQAWRISTSLQEKEKLIHCDRFDNGCRKQVLRIMKAFLQQNTELKKLTSFHMKTILLYLMDYQSDWSQASMALRVVDMLYRLEKCLENKFMEHFFIPNINLLQNVKDEALQNMYYNIQNIRTNKNRFSMIFLQNREPVFASPAVTRRKEGFDGNEIFRSNLHLQSETKAERHTAKQNSSCCELFIYCICAFFSGVFVTAVMCAIYIYQM